LIVGGICWFFTASAVITASTAPDAPIKCPVIALVPLTASRRAWEPNTSLIASVSMGSLRRVADAWALM